NLPAANGGHQLFQVRDLPDIGAFVDQAAHMDGKPSVIYVICLFAEQIEQLGVYHGDQEVEGRIRVRHDEEQRCFSVTQGVQLQLIVGRNLPKLRNIKGGQAGTAGNKDRLRGLAGSQLVKTVLPHRKVVRLPLSQLFKHDIHRVLILL